MSLLVPVHGGREQSGFALVMRKRSFSPLPGERKRTGFCLQCHQMTTSQLDWVVSVKPACLGPFMDQRLPGGRLGR